MRFCIFILAVFFLLPSVLDAESFYIRRPRLLVSEEEEHFSPLPSLKIGVTGIYSGGSISDNNGDKISSRMAGVRGDIQVKIASILSAGIEGSRLWAADQKVNLVHTITRDSGTFVLHVTLTPNTQSRLYVVGGMGLARYRASFNLAMHPIKHQSTVFMGGIGVEFPLAKHWYLAGEYRLVYEVQPWENFILRGPRTREECGLSIGYSF